ncbi:MAG: serine/threonine protein phosphatase [Ruminococcaceae bacterium]|nr:serine/threonine protein phosphatase [Oscillospiraceae bacterium]
MSLFAIGDTHLSFGTDKPMNVFRGWDNYVERLETNWKTLVGADDTVVIMGDVSWAMNFDELKKDLEFINSLPGQKIILKGNHDYWWNTLSKMNAFLKENSFDTVKFLYNNAYPVGNISVCGTRGWFFDCEEEHAEKIVLREAGRLRTSIQKGRETGLEPVVFLHYPPLSKTEICQPIFNVLKEECIRYCYYAHLHSASAYNSFNGEYEGIRFELLSADYLKFCPRKLNEIK